MVSEKNYLKVCKNKINVYNIRINYVKGVSLVARLNLNVSDDLQRKVKEYCELNDITVTTFYHMAVAHYLNHLQMTSDFTDLFKGIMASAVKNAK